MSSIASPSPIGLFPAAAVEACIREALALASSEQATLHGVPATEVSSWEPEVDSLTALDVLETLREQLGIDLPDDVVPVGGYAGVEDCAADLVAKARDAWSAQHAEAVT